MHPRIFVSGPNRTSAIVALAGGDEYPAEAPKPARGVNAIRSNHRNRKHRTYG
jgi:hypothetical protein